MKSNLSIINVYKKKNTKSKLVTQLLCGESFKIIKKNGKWIKIKNHSDGYKGFIITIVMVIPSLIVLWFIKNKLKLQ